MTGDLVLKRGEKVTTTSMIVAEIFGKQHKDVLRAIELLECSDEFRERNFALSSYKSLQNKRLPIYLITRDGFSFLAMGFTGPKAAQFKEAFIEAFNKMETALLALTAPVLLPTYSKRIMSKPAKTCPTSRWCIFKESSEIMLDIEMGVGSINEFDLVDGSIGTHWMKFRSGKPWAKPVTQYYHEHKDKRGNRLSNCFDLSELGHFRDWLENMYKPGLLPGYLREKFRREPKMKERVEAFLPKLLGTPESV
jgi:Rha family phage regulatory protein